MIVAARCRFCCLPRRWFEAPGTRALVSTTEAGRDCQAPDNLHKPCRPRTDEEIATEDHLRRQRNRALFGRKSRPASDRK